MSAYSAHRQNHEVLIPFRNRERVKPYIEALRRVAGLPEARSVDEPLSIAGYGGLLLTGGTDVNPERYGQKRKEHVDDPDDRRDEVELRLIDEALEQDLPILAICRGMQILNVHHGGTLHQHLDDAVHDGEHADRGARAHDVQLDTSSHLYQIYGTDLLPVNSRHHQGVDRLGEGLRISAYDKEKREIVEGLELPTRRFVIAVQWHPEDQIEQYSEQLRLFQHFSNAIQGS